MRFKIIFFIFFLYSSSYAQDYILRVDTFAVNQSNQYRLSSLIVIPFSEHVYIDGSMIADSNYIMSYEFNEIRLKSGLTLDSSQRLIVAYKSLEINIPRIYQKRVLQRRYTVPGYDSTYMFENTNERIKTRELSKTNITASGSIVRGFNIGATRDFSVTSGLRLQMSGNITDDIRITAALTDENTPIQPEGNTERLDELDKVYIELAHKNALAIFGDYDLNLTSGEFGKINRKLVGIKGEAMFENYNGVIAYANARGKFTTNSFFGVDGSQGPYRLVGANNERDIIIIAGSEKVHIDGEQVKRGEDNDYVVEYGNAEILFTPKRIITSSSRITVEFIYSDRKYSRNFFASQYFSSHFNERFDIGLNFIREGDDYDSPLDIEITDEDRKILKDAGDNKLLAYKSGVTLVHEDTFGVRKGVYIKKDTLINLELKSIYVFAPDDPLAEYNVSFSYIGEGQGEYVKEKLGAFRYVGQGRGAYLPIIFLSAPELKQNASAYLGIKPFEKLKTVFEIGGSYYDKNRFSPLNSEDNSGFAGNVIISLDTISLKLFDDYKGGFGFKFRERRIDKYYAPAERLNSIEFDRDYDRTAADKNGDETLREFEVYFNPFKKIYINSNYGQLKDGLDFNSKRYGAGVSVIDYNGFFFENKNELNVSRKSYENGEWFRHNTTARYAVLIFMPSIETSYENKTNKLIYTDSLSEASFRFIETTPGLSVYQLGGVEFGYKYSYRVDYFPYQGELLRESRSITQFYELDYNGSEELNSNLSLIFRKKKYEKEFMDKNGGDVKQTLARWLTRFDFAKKSAYGDLFYEASFQRSAKYERVFIQTQRGLGTHKYLGDLNNDGIRQENEFEPTLYDGDYIALYVPMDETEPVIDLKLNFRIKLQFDKIIKEASPFFNILKIFSTETLFRVEENSKETQTQKIYLLDFSKYLNDSTTIRGANIFQHDFHLYENSNEFSLRIRYLERKSLNSLSGGFERSYYRERGIRIKTRIIEDIANQTEYTNYVDAVAAPSSLRKARYKKEDELKTDFSYRLTNDFELGFEIETAKAADYFPVSPTIIYRNFQTLRFLYSILNIGSLRGELRRAELTAKITADYVPFEVTRGYIIGKNYSWNLSFDYRIGGNLLTSLVYEGRQQGKEKAVYLLKAEARAYF